MLRRKLVKKPWVAGLLSAVLPGMGQHYIGNYSSAFILLVGFIFLSVFSGAIISLYLPSDIFLVTFISSQILLLILYQYAIINAARSLRRKKVKAELSKYRLFLHAISTIVIWVFLLLPASIWIHRNIMEPFTVPTRSMVPTILPGDLLIADKRKNCSECLNDLHHGDVITFIYPENRELLYVKRIVGMPGDVVQLRNKRVTVNGKQLLLSGVGKGQKENNGLMEYTIRWNNYDQESGKWVVPKNHVFVMGDNRSHSRDSRDFGYVPIADIRGKARMIWFSYHKSSGIRWSRMGQML